MKKNKPYKTIGKNPEVFDTMMVTSVEEQKDGSAIINLEFSEEQRNMLFDVFIREAMIEGLKSVDSKSEKFSEELSIKRQVIDQTRVVLECISHWETSDDYDWSPNVANEVQLLRDLMARLK